MPETIAALDPLAIPFYAVAPSNGSFSTVGANGQITLEFDTVPSGQTWTGTITVVPAAGQSIAGSTWTISRDGSSPFLSWSDNQVAVDVQGRDGQQIMLTGTGLATGTQVQAFWSGRNDNIANKAVPIASPWIAGSPSLTILDSFANTLASLIATGSATGAPGGAPALRFTNDLANNPAGVSLGALSSTQPLLNQAVKQPSFEAVFFTNMNTANVGTVPFMQVEIDWIDAVSGQINDIEQYIIATGNGPGNSIATFLRGPCNGNLMSVFITNLDPAQSATAAWTINETSEIYEHDRLFQPKYSLAPNGFTNPSGSPAQGVLAVASPTVLPSTSSTRLLATWSGKVGININARAQANNISYTLEDPGTLYSGTANAPFWSTDTPTGGGQVYAEVVLPNGPVQLRELNRGTTGNVAPVISVVKLEY